MKRLLKILAILLVLLNMLIVLSGKRWIYKALSITYFKGEISSYIHDFVYFPHHTVSAGNHQEWLVNHQDLDIFYARGLWGQYIICIPEKNMILVRLGRKFGTLLPSHHYEDLFTFIDASLEMYP